MTTAPVCPRMWPQCGEQGSAEDLIGGVACAPAVREEEGLDRHWAHTLKLPADAFTAFDMKPVREDHEVPFSIPRLDRPSREPVVSIGDRLDQPVFLNDRGGRARERVFENEEVAGGYRHRLIGGSGLPIYPDGLQGDAPEGSSKEGFVGLKGEVPIVRPRQFLFECIDVRPPVGVPVERRLSGVVSRFKRERRGGSSRQFSDQLVRAPEIVGRATPLSEDDDCGRGDTAHVSRGDPRAVASQRRGHEEEPNQHGIYLSLNGSPGIR